MIQVSELRKSYDGVHALRGISFTVPTGAIFGFIGPNGAGKTTTLKILGTLLEPSSGTAKVMGVDVLRDPLGVRRVIGWMPDQYGMYGDLKVWEYLDFFAGAYRIPRSRRMDVIETVLGLVDLHAKRDALVAGLSRGMTQRLCLGRALLHEPSVLLLDEPASGLDPQARIEMRELFKELQRMGKTILVSSHILPELAEYCNGVAIIQEGRVLFSGTMAELAARTGEGLRRVRVRSADPPDRIVSLLATRPEVKGARVPEALEAAADGAPPSDAPGAPAGEAWSEVEADVKGSEADLSAILQFLLGSGVRIASFREVPMDLGDVFLKITREDE